MVRNLFKLKGVQLYLVSALPFFFALTEDADGHAENLQKWEMTSEWVELFNGRNLDGWKPKIKGYPLGTDERETFRVEDGLLKVRYDGYSAFDNQFGHLFFSTPVSKYDLLIEYRFVGKQLEGGPQWAERNSGVMIHSQSPQSMQIDQDFPDSLEVQFLGGIKPDRPRPTANLCTPGTEVIYQKKRLATHCTYSQSETYLEDQWVQVLVKVNAGEEIQHWLKNKLVMRYKSPFLTYDKKENRKISKGFIAIQSESHPIDFRRIAIRRFQIPN